MKRVIHIFFITALIVGMTWVTGSTAEKKVKEDKAKVTVTEVPVGSPRTAEEFSRDADYLIEGRRAAVSDGDAAYLFKPGRCLKCHENKPGVEGQIFYGNPDFSKELNWPDFIDHPEEKHAPSLEYNFYDNHAGKKKRLPIAIGQDIEQRLKQMQ